ncbi:site-specific DNA-methyltransferase [Aestuariibaculum sp. M13]|uniref:site-specific DNA-methyltransferase n=1 Tax=Aestuariibaculum sp. M13 TaxID=2967132 RepID=UPI002159D142|nr:site-specific DNA-methyltransferase [Aestuariibaculum sp. M13]MCR8667944.1 site-specific DNA-methyltransferase [Aestuariibaculum sp. M13]
MEQGKLDIQVEKKLETVEDYKFEPIKGYAMLHWKGKRPFTSTQFYPAQLKETYGKEVNGWLNKIFWGDNLQVMSHLLKEYRGKIDLIYIDPPFDSKADYKKSIGIKNKTSTTDINAFEEKQYTDLWSSDGYLQFMYERIILLRELLNENGVISLHCDWHKVHNLRCIMDEVFGHENFVNEIIWQKIRTAKSQSTSFGNIHDTILIYSKTKSFTYNKQYFEPDFKKLKKHYSKTDEQGRIYQPVSFTQDGQGEPRDFGEKGILIPPPGKHWIWSQDRIWDGLKKGLIEFSDNGNPKKKMFLDDVKGTAIGDIWTDIFPLNSMSKERTDYPTQKPEKLLERIITTYTNPGDLVFDSFMGSGTTQNVSMIYGRRFLGSDINLGAIETTIKRLLKTSKSIEIQSPSIKVNSDNENDSLVDIFYTGYSVFNVNNYDVFRNPVQAKEILKQALEIQPLPNNTIYDGEKDGRMVKIMPVNRIATRADLNELISGFNIKSFEKKFETSPNKPVENILLICMGHEPDLAATLQKEMHPFKLDVEVVDILRDKANLEFKRDSEAEVKITDDTLVIEQFYPMNLLQKLSLMKENVEDWKELTESVKIDFNYDGAVFEPQIVDVPEKNELVLGEYPIPEDAGTIRIKITDLLSESLELTIEN